MFIYVKQYPNVTPYIGHEISDGVYCRFCMALFRVYSWLQPLLRCWHSSCGSACTEGILSTSIVPIVQCVQPPLFNLLDMLASLFLSAGSLLKRKASEALDGELIGPRASRQRMEAAITGISKVYYTYKILSTACNACSKGTSEHSKGSQ